MKKANSIILFSSLSFLISSSLFAQEEDKPLSEHLKKQKQEIEEMQKVHQEQKAAPKRSADKERDIFLEDLDAMLESNSLCYHEKEEVDIRVCILNANKDLAEKGNFIAQDVVAKNYLEFHQNDQMALKWYKAALENPRTPDRFRKRLIGDINKLEAAIKQASIENHNKGEYSEATKQEIEQINIDKENALKQKRKAELLEDKENIVIYNEIEHFLNAATPCYDKKDEHDIYICSLKTIKKLAERGNFIAQHQLGNIYENSYENKKMAIKWYQAGLDNKRTPPSYRSQFTHDLERAKESQNNENK